MVNFQNIFGKIQFYRIQIKISYFVSNISTKSGISWELFMLIIIIRIIFKAADWAYRVSRFRTAIQIYSLTVNKL